MSNDIKVGDLVMVVKPMPCCGYSGKLGMVFRAGKVVNCIWRCAACGYICDTPSPRAHRPDGALTDLNRLKKIDPPAEGDSLPTRADLDIPASA